MGGEILQHSVEPGRPWPLGFQSKIPGVFDDEDTEPIRIIKGFPASSGITEGKARVVNSPDEISGPVRTYK